METIIIYIIASVIVLFFPGYVIQAYLLKRTHDFSKTLILSLGLSIAFIALLFLWASIFNLILTRFTIILLYTLFIIIGLYIIFQSYSISTLARNALQIPHFWVACSIILLTLAARLYTPIGSDFPIGIDSHSHAIITKLIVENNGLPDTYLPYAPLDSFTYHFSFHAIAAVLNYLTGKDIIETIFFTGQILNAIIVLSIYLFSYEITKNRTVALLSMIFVGWISIFPAYYVNWGRYTQTTGLVILPITLAFITQNIEKDNNKLGTYFISAMLIGGLFLSHYRIFLVFIYFIISYIIINYLYANNKLDLFKKYLIFFPIIVLTSIVMISPQILALLKSEFSRDSNLIPQDFFSLDSLYYLKESYFNYLFLIKGYFVYSVVLIGGLSGICHHHFRKNALIIILWILLMFTFSNPFWIDIPFSGYLDLRTVYMILFLPLSVLFGYGLKLVFDFLKTAENFQLKLLLSGSLILILIVSNVNAFTIYREKPSPQYVFDSDLEAMDWIINNTRNDSIFLINGYHNKYSGWIEGTDGGWWIPFFTKREVSIPPMLYGGENAIIANYSSVISDIYEASIFAGSNNSLNLFKNYNITYIYIGERGGPIDIKELIRNPNYQQVYHKQGVRIFKIVYKSQNNDEQRSAKSQKPEG